MIGICRDGKKKLRAWFPSGRRRRLKSGKQDMYQITKDTVRLCGLLLGLLLWLAAVSAVQAEDDYLSILEAEAEDTGASSNPVSKPDKANTHNDKPRYVKADKLIEPGLSFEAFEETLSTRYSGSNFLYVKLTESNRRGVYRFYQGDNRISSVREEIVRLLSSS
jgi:hypothetical protein